MTAADLTPDALAKLEAKLMTDLEMVRKVRALLLEHQPALGGAGGAPPAATAAAPAPVSEPQAPARPLEDVLKECLAATGGQPFAPQDFKSRMLALTKQWPDDKEVKVFLNRMIRQGCAVVHEVRKGRSGSLYLSLLPVTEDAAPSGIEAAAVADDNEASSS